ncbi:MAG: hypothetical protein NDI90_00205 [Nitrospira sp. BO4]|jgi:CRISPR/Cas system-associated endoribonuclease Cas2|nr:hypothetical protein [Nitrospira sp. BO4]
MALYLISYDLTHQGQNSEKLVAAFQLEGAKRILNSVWGLNTTLPMEEVRDWVLSFLNTNDRLLVCGFKDWTASNAMVDIDQLWKAPHSTENIPYSTLDAYLKSESKMLLERLSENSKLSSSEVQKISARLATLESNDRKSAFWNATKRIFET